MILVALLKPTHSGYALTLWEMVMGVTSGAGTAYPSGAHEFNPCS